MTFSTEFKLIRWVGGVQKYADDVIYIGMVPYSFIVQDENNSLTCGAFFMNLFGSKVGITISSEHFLFRNNSSGT